MSLQHIVDAANRVAQEGKQPSVALIKSRLTQPASLRDIIETLKTWQFDPMASIPAANAQIANPETADPMTALIAKEIAAVRAEFAPLRQEVIELRAEIVALKKALLTQ